MGNTPSNARLRVLKTVDPRQVIAMLIEEHGFDYILDSVLDQEDAGKGVDLSTVDACRKHLQRSSGFDFDIEGSDEEILEIARGIFGTWRVVYAACPWPLERIAAVRDCEPRSVYQEATKARTLLRNSEGITTNA